MIEKLSIDRDINVIQEPNTGQQSMNKCVNLCKITKGNQRMLHKVNTTSLPRWSNPHARDIELEA